MPLDNPAGRLHAIFLEFSADPNRTILDAWTATLGVPPDLLLPELERVNGLIEDTRKAAHAAGPAFAPIPDYLIGLSRAVFPLDTGFSNSIAAVYPDKHGLQLLHALDTNLSAMAADGSLPDPTEIEEIDDELKQLVMQVIDSDLPLAAREALLRHLHDMRAALAGLATGGPKAVAEAAETLAGVTTLYESSVERVAPALVANLKRVVVVAMFAFSVAPVQVVDTLNAWATFGEAVGLVHKNDAPTHALPPGE